MGGEEGKVQEASRGFGGVFKLQNTMLKIDEQMKKDGIIGNNDAQGILSYVEKKINSTGLDNLKDIRARFGLNKLVGPPVEDYINNPEVYEQKWGIYVGQLLKKETEELVAKGHLDQNHEKVIHGQVDIIHNTMAGKTPHQNDDERITALENAFSGIQQTLPENLRNGFGNNMGEAFAVLGEVSKGGLVYIPSAGNAPLGDMISLVNRDKSNPKFIKVLVEGRGLVSIKKNEGGQFSLGELTNGIDIGGGNIQIDKEAASDIAMSKYLVGGSSGDGIPSTKGGLQYNRHINKALFAIAGVYAQEDENNNLIITKKYKYSFKNNNINYLIKTLVKINNII